VIQNQVYKDDIVSLPDDPSIADHPAFHFQSLLQQHTARSNSLFSLSCLYDYLKMHAKLVTLLLPVLAAATPVKRAGDAPDPNEITIVDTTYSGNGCPQGSVSTSTSTDKTVSLFNIRSVTSQHVHIFSTHKRRQEPLQQIFSPHVSFG
jgi:hypothetical protein